MATTRLKLFSRHVLEGASATSQGADAVQELLITAYNDMAEAEWMPDDSAPTMPVHEYDRPRPRGDAYNATWGYEAETRSERSCCGAVCYTYKIPADAIDQTTHGPCSLQSVAVRIRGDRYLNSGAIVAAMQSDDPEPPAWAAVLAAVTSSDPVCATSDQLDPETGEPLPPNQRAGETADVSIAFSATPLGYVHVVLRCADYLEHRGAWIEGGALVVNSAASAQFSRDVEEDPLVDVLESVPMDIGYTIGNETGSPAGSAFASLSFGCDFLSTGQIDEEVRNAIATIFAPPGLIDNGLIRTGVWLDNVVSVFTKGVTCFAATLPGLTKRGVFDRVRFASPFALGCDARIVAYGIMEPVVAVGMERVHGARVVPEFKTVVSEDFFNAITNAIEAFLLDESPDHTYTVPVLPLACVDVPSGTEISAIDFDRRFETGRVSTILVAIIPTGCSDPGNVPFSRVYSIDGSSLSFVFENVGTSGETITFNWGNGFNLNGSISCGTAFADMIYKSIQPLPLPSGAPEGYYEYYHCKDTFSISMVENPNLIGNTALLRLAEDNLLGKEFWVGGKVVGVSKTFSFAVTNRWATGTHESKSYAAQIIECTVVVKGFDLRTPEFGAMPEVAIVFAVPSITFSFDVNAFDLYNTTGNTFQVHASKWEQLSCPGYWERQKYSYDHVPVGVMTLERTKTE